ncbi:MAG: undecaprenyl-diphosphate phosphatase, partial [Actinobacteria bacterium]|nr:undecaprenyl-diphosphate phosphatase [Actinomycetota bacterium]
MEVHDLHGARLHPLGPDARLHRRPGRRQLGGVARQAALLRLRRARGPDRAGRLGLPQVAPRQGRGRDRGSGRLRAGGRGLTPVPAGSEGDGTSPAIPPSRAVVLGAVQGPTELLPVSSSAHLTLVPWLADWDWERFDPELRKSFEVALHVGAALALLIGQRRVIERELGSFDRRKAEVLALSFLPGAAIGLIAERQIERRLGGPFPTAVGLIAGALAMAIADRRPQSRVRG